MWTLLIAALITGIWSAEQSLIAAFFPERRPHGQDFWGAITVGLLFAAAVV